MKVEGEGGGWRADGDGGDTYTETLPPVPS